MSPETVPVPERLARAFAPPEGGVPGLVEQLLRACAGADICFERTGTRCVCRWTEGGVVREQPVPVPPQAFRTLLARIAERCNEHRPGSVSPYGGDGTLVVGGHEVAVSFVNTAAAQKLELRTAAPGTEADGPARAGSPLLDAPSDLSPTGT